MYTLKLVKETAKPQGNKRVLAKGKKLMSSRVLASKLGGTKKKGDSGKKESSNRGT